jgi:hypothetical protein
LAIPTSNLFLSIARIMHSEMCSPLLLEGYYFI